MQEEYLAICDSQEQVIGKNHGRRFIEMGIGIKLFIFGAIIIMIEES